MARIIGKIESLKTLKSELKNSGITRFNSVKEINDFLSDFENEKLSILKKTSENLDKEYSQTSINLRQLIEDRTELIKLETNKLEKRISDLEIEINLIKNKKVNNFFLKLYSSFKLYSTKNSLNYLLNNKTKLIDSSAFNISKKIKSDEEFIDKYQTDKQSLIDKRANLKIEKLEYTRKVLKNSRNLISGAIGENLVVKEIKKLSDDYVLINDFKVSFYPSIFYKKHNQRINSIQIDHLLISKAGIFIIETKNWSKSSVNSLSLRSPIEQIERSNFALYVYISENISLSNHHWGEQKIPIRNLIVMINNKPNASFKYVTIKLLRELNDYIKYFEPVLTDNQFNKIVNNLT